MTRMGEALAGTSDLLRLAVILTSQSQTGLSKFKAGLIVEVLMDLDYYTTVSWPVSPLPTSRRNFASKVIGRNCI
jgi:hypothetical protein